MSKLLVALALLATACSSRDAPSPSPGSAPGPGARTMPEDPVGNELIAPELVMQNQAAIGLSQDQRAGIETALREAQQQMVQLQFATEAAREKLVGALRAYPADEAAVLAAADETMSHENKIKHAHLQLSVRVRNLLTSDQIAKLRTLRH